MGPLHLFYLFHRDGIQTFEPDTCGFRLALTGSSPLPDSTDTLCGVEPKTETRKCEWGDAVSVDDRYIYATQPTQNRVVVIDARSQRIIEVGLIGEKHNPLHPCSRSLCVLNFLSWS